jgi:hypothetical protein
MDLTTTRKPSKRLRLIFNNNKYIPVPEGGSVCEPLQSWQTV